MNPRILWRFLMLFLLFMFLYAGTMDGFDSGGNPFHWLEKGEVGANSRNLLGFSAVVDYDYAGPNPKHDPRGKRGGGSSRNP